MRNGLIGSVYNCPDSGHVQIALLHAVLLIDTLERGLSFKLFDLRSRAYLIIHMGKYYFFRKLNSMLLAEVWYQIHYLKVRHDLSALFLELSRKRLSTSGLYHLNQFVNTLFCFPLSCLHIIRPNNWIPG